MHLFVALTFFALLCFGQQPIFLDTSFVSPTSTQTVADQVIWFRATVCQGASLDGLLATLRVTLQDQPWGPDFGVFVAISVFNSTEAGASPICTNLQDGVYTPYCPFTYYSSLSTLYVRAQSGPTGNIAYTLNFKFAIGSAPFSLPKRAQFLNEIVDPKDIIELRQIAKLDKPSTVPNLPPSAGGIVEFAFAFCPISIRYNISAIVLATDLQSDFETYLCLTHPCTAVNAIVRDTCDCPTNILTITSDRPLSTLFLTVRGRGEYAKQSSFLLSLQLNQ